MSRGAHRVLNTGACLGLVALGAVWVAWLGFRVQTPGDYASDYAPAMNALLAGHLGAFFGNLPTNGAGGSLLLRAPAAMLGKATLGGQLEIFRFGAFFCVFVTGLLGLYLARGIRTAQWRSLTRATVVGVCVLSPTILDAILFGHPEEPLGAALCVGAVLLAGRRRTTLAGVALGLAMINKPWGALAIPPVLLAARHGRAQLIAVAGGIVGAWFGAAYLVSPAQFARAAHGASTAVVAHPEDLWWPLAKLHIVPAVTHAYLAPHLISAHARQLVLLLAVPPSLVLARRGVRDTDSALALMALLLLCRCLLDPSNHVYYQVPLVIAIAAWEVVSGRFPIRALAATGSFWLIFHAISGTGSLAAQFVVYLAVALALGAMLLRPALGMPQTDRWAPTPAKALDRLSAVRGYGAGS
jgi:hypothetical protein